MEVMWVRYGAIDKGLPFALHQVFSVDRRRDLNCVFFKLGDLSYIPEAVCNTPEDEDFGT